MEAIDEIVGAKKIDLIIMGTQGKLREAKEFFGSKYSAIPLKELKCPVYWPFPLLMNNRLQKPFYFPHQTTKIDYSLALLIEKGSIAYFEIPSINYRYKHVCTS